MAMRRVGNLCLKIYWICILCWPNHVSVF